MARPKETDEQKVKKVYKDAVCVKETAFGVTFYTIQCCGVDFDITPFALEDLAWSDALNQIRKAKIKSAKDKRKKDKPAKVREIKKHVGLTMYPTDKAIIVKGFGSVQKFFDSKVNEYKLTIKTN